MTYLYLSYVLVWVIVLVLVLAVYLLAQQIGLLHRRMPPIGARITNEGLELGDVLPPNNSTELAFWDRDKRLLIIAIAPRCSNCEALGLSIRTVAGEWRDRMHVLILSMAGEDADLIDFTKRHRLDKLTASIVSPRLAVRLRISSPPYAMLFSREGRLIGKGVVNHLEHLQSIASIQDSEAARVG